MAEQTIIRVSDVLNQAGPKGAPAITDGEILASCEGCKQQVALSSCKITQTAETTYRCANCDSILVIIGSPNPDENPPFGRGDSDFSIRNAVDLTFLGVLMPGTR